MEEKGSTLYGSSNKRQSSGSEPRPEGIDRRRIQIRRHAPNRSSRKNGRLSPTGTLFLLSFFTVIAGSVAWLLAYGGVSPRERARMEMEKPIGPLPNGDPPPIAAAGRVIYERNCMSCHGLRLSGGSAPRLRARRYEPSRWTDQDLVNVIFAGSANMPAFKDSLSAGEIAAVVSYIRWEQGLPLPEVGANQLPETTAP